MRVEVLARSDGALELMLLPDGGASIAGPVSEAARANGWQVTELHIDRGRLDDVFRQITTGNGDASDG